MYISIYVCACVHMICAGVCICAPYAQSVHMLRCMGMEVLQCQTSTSVWRMCFGCCSVAMSNKHVCACVRVLCVLFTCSPLTCSACSDPMSM